MGTKEKLQQIISNQMGIPIEEIKESLHFQEDLNADSLDLVEVVMAIEEEFNIEIPDNVAEKFRTLQDVLDYFTDQGVS